MAVNDLYQFNVIGSAQGQAHYNVQHWSISAQTGAGVTYAEFLAEWETEIKPLYLACLGDFYTLSGYTFKRILPTLGYISESGATPPVVGDIAGAPEPAYVAAVIAIRTFLVSRSGRGRFYLGAQVDSNTEATDGNRFTAAYLALLQALADRLELSLDVTGAGGTATFRFAVYSQLLNTYNNAVEVLTSMRPATMRSRKYRGLVGA